MGKDWQNCEFLIVALIWLEAFPSVFLYTLLMIHIHVEYIMYT